MFNYFSCRSALSTLTVVSCSLVLGSIFSGCDRKVPPSVRAQAPAFELKDSAGNAHRLEDMRGHVVLIHFWASWCPPCLEEIPRWISAAPQFRDFPVKMVAISVDEQWSEALKILPQADVPANMVSLLDPTSTVARSYGTSRFPESFLLDPDLKIVEKWQGIIDWKSPRVRFAVNKALVNAKRSLPKQANAGVSTPQTPAPVPSAR